MKLEDINKENIFKVPENYFKEFPGRLDKTMKEDKSPKSVPVFTIQNVLKMAAAAVFIIFAIVGIRQLGNQKSNSPLDILASVTTEELLAYLEDSDISTDDLLTTIDLSIMEEDDSWIEDNILLPEYELDDESIEHILNEYEIEMEYL